MKFKRCVVDGELIVEGEGIMFIVLECMVMDEFSVDIVIVGVVDVLYMYV